MSLGLTFVNSGEGQESMTELKLSRMRTIGESAVRQGWLIASKLRDSGPVQISKASNVYGSSK